MRAGRELISQDLTYVIVWFGPLAAMVLSAVFVWIRVRPERRRLYIIGIFLLPWAAFLLGGLLPEVIGSACDIRLKGGGTCPVWGIDLHEPILGLQLTGGMYAIWISLPVVVILLIWEAVVRFLGYRRSGR